MRPARLPSAKALTFAFCLFTFAFQAQPVCPAGPYPNANTCAAACVFCGNLNGFSSATAMAGVGQPVPGFCTQIVHSMKYVAFIAGSTSLSIDVTVGTCTLGNAIEMGIYDSPDCQSFSLISNCNTMMSTGQAYSFSTTEPMHPGCQYYLVFDNNGPAACNFTVAITAGSTGSTDLPAPPLPVGPAQFCPGASLVFSIPPQDFACEYEWAAPPGATIDGLPSPALLDHEGGNSVVIKMGNTPGNICVRAKNACKTSPWACRAVSLKTIAPTLFPPASVCQGQFFEWLDGNFYGQPQLLSFTFQTPDGCDSTVKQQLKINLPTLTNLGPQRICPGECVTLAGLTACAPGLFDTVLMGAAGCDSIVRFNVTVIPVDAQIAPVGDSLDCNLAQILLDGHGSVGQIWKWFGPSSLAPIGSDTVQAAAQPGLFKLILENTLFGKTCRDTAQTVVNQSVSQPSVQVFGQNITCQNPIAQLSATVLPPTAGLFWQGPNGFQSTITNPQANQPGLYFLETTDPTNGCTARDSILILENKAAPVFTVNADTITCDAPTAQLFASSQNPDLTFQWIENQQVIATGPSFSSQNPGSFQVVATAPANGCTAIYFTQILENKAAPVFTVNADTITCDAPTAQLFASSQNPDLTFQWIENQQVIATGPSFASQNPGSFQVVATAPANGCTAIYFTQILENKAAPVFSVNADTITCDAPTAQLFASSQNPDLTFQWIENQQVIATGPSFSSQNPGSFQVVATAQANGCTAIYFTQIFENKAAPVFTVNADTITCDAPTAQLFASSQNPDLTFQWIENQQVIATGAAFSSQNPGSFQVVATAQANGCTAIYFTQILGNKAAPVFTVNADTITCDAPTAQLFASSQNPDLTFQWIENQQVIATGPSFSSQNPGSFQVVATAPANGCTATIFAKIDADIEAPVVTIAPPDPITCANPVVPLFASAAATSGPLVFEWGSTLGGGVSGQFSANCTVGLADIYTVVVVNQINGCASSASATVAGNVDFPNIDAGPPQVLTCKNPTALLVGSGDAGSDFSLLWTTADGQILANADGFSPTAGAAGAYFFKIKNKLTGCESTDYALVSENFAAPVVDAGAGQTLDCGSPFLMLNGSVAAGISLNWTTAGGHFIDAPNQISPKINAPGQYFLTATDPANGCTAIDSVLIAPDAAAPVVAIAPPGFFSCKTAEIQLFATAAGASPNPILTQNWTTAGGQILSGATSLAPKIGKPGSYILTVSDGSNGCSALVPVTVAGDFEPPVINFSSPAPLTCDVLTTTISATVTTASGGFSFEWIPAPGLAILSGQNTLMPTVGAPGNYQIVATDPTNGCADTLTVVVAKKQISQHLVAIFPAGSLDCTIPVLTLHAALTFSGPGFGILWKTGDGLIVSGGGTLTPEIGAGGTYTLIIKDLGSGCVDSVSIFIVENFTKPAIVIAPPAVLNCLKTTAKLLGNGSGQGPISKKWTTAGGQFLGATDQFSATATAPGLYFFEIMDSLNGCISRDSVEVLEDVAPPIFSIKTDSITCLNPVAKLSAIFQNTDLAFVWAELSTGTSPQPVGISPDFGTAEPGVFSLTATDPANGCTASDLVFISKSEAITGVSLDLDLPLCFDGPGAVLLVAGVAGAVEPVAYSIDNQPFSSKNEWAGLPSGGYFLKIRDAAGCTFDTLVTVAAPLDWQASLGPDTTIILGEKVRLSVATAPADIFLESIKWQPAVFVGCDTCRSEVVAPKHDRWFEIVATDVFGCTRTDSILVKVLAPQVFVPNVFSPNGDSGNDVFRVFCGPGVVKIRRFAVFTRWGDAVYFEKNGQPDDPNFGWNGRFRGKMVQEGVYVWFLQAELLGGRVLRMKGDVTVVR